MDKLAICTIIVMIYYPLRIIPCHFRDPAWLKFCIRIGYSIYKYC